MLPRSQALAHGMSRRVSFAGLDAPVVPDENQPLLADVEDGAGDDGCVPLSRHQPQYPAAAKSLSDLPVYTTIHRVRHDVLNAIDENYSLEQLKDPRMNIAVLRPLVDKYYKSQDISVVYCLLVNRAQFLKEHAVAPHVQSVNITRALLCELVANRILRRYNEANPGPEGLLLLANILVGGFDCFQNAPPGVCEGNAEAMLWIQKRRGVDKKLPALEVAIISESKTLLSSSACQRVIGAIYEGRVIYTPGSFIDIIPDTYKQKPISLYDPRNAPLLNQYRLIVPRTRNILEVTHFVVMLSLYITVMNIQDPGPLRPIEICFLVYCLGWVLDQFASILEHGWTVYTQNLWSFLDVMFTAVYFVYVFMRLHGLRTGSVETGSQALDVLALGAPVLIPRLAFNLLSENILFVSLRSMIQDFALLSLLAIWCFAGFLMSMIWLGDGSHRPITISKWMLWVWFGLDGTGIQRSVELHTVLGPVLMVLFAFLGNTLFLTVLVSMLSNTFAGIVTNASAEIQFRRAVLTLEGVKADAIFAYQPPFNIVALCTLLPLKFFVSPRWFHKINVAAVRTLNAPLLLVVGYVERRVLWANIGGVPSLGRRPELTRTRSASGFWTLSRFSVHGDISAVFQTEPPSSIGDDDEGERSEGDITPQVREQSLASDPTQDDGKDTAIPTSGKEDQDDTNTLKPPKSPRSERPSSGRQNSETYSQSHSRSRSRRDSMAPYGGLREQLRNMLNDVAVEEGDHEEVSRVRQRSPGTSMRLDKLEENLRRIEDMLVNISRNLGVVSGNGPLQISPLEDDDRQLESERHV